jgi:hypothetical protein
VVKVAAAASERKMFFVFMAFIFRLFFSMHIIGLFTKKLWIA